MAYELKEQGNAHFKEGDYVGAEELYSQAIKKNPREATYFNNRSLARLRLEDWSGAEQDARKAVDLFDPKNRSSIKAQHNLARALLGLQHPQEALSIAIAAYRKSLELKDPNSEALSRTILETKKAIWAAKETARLREANETLRKMEELLEADLQTELQQLEARRDAGEIGQIGFVEDQRIVKEEAEKRLQRLRDAFTALSGGELQERIVPDYLIDSITFEIMHDPVMTLSGHSFDRVGIMKHLEQTPVDPMTRVPMTPHDLRPNYALKAACEDFLAKNGWAVDW